MKRRILYIVALFAFISLLFTQCHSGASNNNTRYVLSDTIGTPVITFSNIEHDFGSIKEGEKVSCVFKFTNTGDADLVLTSVFTSCGCTVSKYNRKPIPPGASGSIEISYDSSDRSGKQTKSITVQSNAKNKIMILRIIAQVINN
jgi:hypothetical protein